MRRITASFLAFLVAQAGCTSEVIGPGEIPDDYPADDPEGYFAPDEGMEEVDWHDESTEPEVLFAAALTVGGAVNATCSTSSVKGLSLQIADEMACMKPSAFTKFTAGGGISFTGSAVLPYMAPQAATALKQVAAVKPLQINSGFRTIAQQYVLYRWSVLGRCGIAVAAKPGRSNHETGRAVDVANWSSVVSLMASKGWSHTVPGDEVHFDYLSAPDLRGLDIKAFQRLWNRNNPNKKIAEDGLWGPQTQSALVASPATGFAKGASCGQAPEPPSPPPPPSAIVIDSNNAKNDGSKAKVEASGAWVASSSSSGSYGGSYLWASTQAVSDGVSFWFYMPSAGTRTIDAWWTAGANRSPAAPFIMFDPSGGVIGKTAVDQRSRGGQWNTLGTWTFKAGWNRVVLSRWAAEGAVVVADAVRVR
jgi:hypothetical protein